MFECHADVAQRRYSIIFLVLWVKTRGRRMKMISYIPSAHCGTKKPKHETDPIFSCLLPHRKQKVSLIPAPRNKYYTMQGAP